MSAWSWKGSPVSNPSSLEGKDEVLRWLRHGAELARDLKRDRATIRDVIWCLIAEAIQFIDRLPDQERRWLSSGTRSGGWNMVGMTLSELRQIERIRMMSGINPFEGTPRINPQSAEIERALGVLEWLNWLNAARMPDRLKKAAVALARGGESDVVHRIYCPTRKPNRTNINEIKIRTVGFILNGLKTAYGLVPGEDLTFVGE
jgi:hypothetical protein